MPLQGTICPLRVASHRSRYLLLQKARRGYFRNMKKGLIIVLLALVGLSVNAQKSISDTTIQFFSFSAQLGLQQSFADLGERFGYGGLTGGGVMYKTRSNWTLEGNVGFFFGQEVKEDTILKPLLTEQGILIGRDGNPADVFIGARGFLISGKVGKIIPVIGPNPNSGLHLSLGMGLMQHKIRIDDRTSAVPQLAGDYKKGYDRLTNGLMLSQSIGYNHFSNNKFFNFYIGTEWYQGFTQSRRSLNFDTGMRDDRQRFDVMGSIVVRWYIPVYKRQPKEFYFY